MSGKAQILDDNQNLFETSVEILVSLPISPKQALQGSTLSSLCESALTILAQRLAEKRMYRPIQENELQLRNSSLRSPVKSS